MSRAEELIVLMMDGEESSKIQAELDELLKKKEHLLPVLTLMELEGDLQKNGIGKHSFRRQVLAEIEQNTSMHPMKEEILKEIQKRTASKRLKPAYIKWTLLGAAVLIMSVTAALPFILSASKETVHASWLSVDGSLDFYLQRGMEIDVPKGKSVLMSFKDRAKLDLKSDAKFFVNKPGQGVVLDLIEGGLEGQVYPKKGMKGFRIDMPRTEVTVLGTRFQLYADTHVDEDWIWVDHGHVQISSFQSQKDLFGEESAWIHANGIRLLGKISSGQLDELRGTIVFEDDFEDPSISRWDEFSRLDLDSITELGTKGIARSCLRKSTSYYEHNHFALIQLKNQANKQALFTVRPNQVLHLTLFASVPSSASIKLGFRLDRDPSGNSGLFERKVRFTGKSWETISIPMDLFGGINENDQWGKECMIIFVTSKDAQMTFDRIWVTEKKESR